MTQIDLNNLERRLDSMEAWFAKNPDHINHSIYLAARAYLNLMRQPDETAELKKALIQAALCLLKDSNGAISDTIWLTDEPTSCTLYEHLLSYTDVDDLSGNVDEDIKTLEALLAARPRED